MSGIEPVKEIDTFIYSNDIGEQTDEPINDNVGLSVPKKLVGNRDNGIISSKKLEEMQFNAVGVDGVWLDVLGDVGNPFFAMISGKAGSGKSTFLVIMSKYFATILNKRVLYISHEEGYTRTLQEKFERCRAFVDNIDISEEMPKNISNYDLVIVDSVTTLDLAVEEVQELINKCRKSNTSLALVYHATKDGQYRGMSNNEHIVDMTIMIEAGITHVGKNRFGGRGQMNVFEYC